MAAGRLHQQLGSRDCMERDGGNIDVFGTILQLEVPLLLRPLKGLLGAYLREPTPGVLVTTQRSVSIPRGLAVCLFNPIGDSKSASDLTSMNFTGSRLR